MTKDSPVGLYTAAVLLGRAISDLFPSALLIRPFITQQHFYYDFVFNGECDERILPLLEEKIRGYLKEQQQITISEMMRQNAAALFEHKQQPLKAAILETADAGLVSVIRIGDFVDFCDESSLGQCEAFEAFKILDVEQGWIHLPEIEPLEIWRISGSSWPSFKLLKQFLRRLDAAQERDPVPRGMEMDLFSVHGEKGDENLLWHPRGSQLLQNLVDLALNEWKQFRSYPLEIQNEDPLPLLLKYIESESATASDWPLRWTGVVKQTDPNAKNYWQPLLRPDSYTLTLSYSVCSFDRLAQEITYSLQIIEKLINMIDLEHEWKLVLVKAKPHSRWQQAVEALKASFACCSLEYVLDNDSSSLYGPVARVAFVDAYGQNWEGPSVAIDVERIVRNRENQTTVITSFLGPVERLLALLVQHCAGVLPFQLAPEIVRVLPVAAEDAPYAEEIRASITRAGWRCGLDVRPKLLKERIYSAERERLPYVVVVGKNEARLGKVSFRSCREQKIRQGVTLEAFLEALQHDAEK